MDLILRHEVERCCAGGLETAPCELLNDLLVDYLQATGFLTSPGLQAAMRRTRRDLFLPGVDPRACYSDRAVRTVADTSGDILSSCSTPSIIVSMVEALGLRGSERVLEIGTGTGYAAALTARSAPDVQVVSVECIEAAASAAAERVRLLGIDGVHVIHGNGVEAARALGPFDRVLVSCGLSDLPEGLEGLLAPGGRIVAPLQGFVHSLERAGSGWRGRVLIPAGFIPLREDESEGSGWRWIDPAASRGTQAVRRGHGFPEGDGPEVWLAEPPSAATALDGVPGSILHSMLLAFQSCDGPRFFECAEEERSWGFGYADKGGVVFCRVEGDYSFRHYPVGPLSVRFEVYGDEAPTEDFFARFESLMTLPPLAGIEVSTDRHMLRDREVFSCLRGETTWVYHCEEPSLSVR